jgi:hypothetical protein
MTFSEARQELTAMVGASTYRALYYELTERSDGTAKQGCRVYANGMVNPTRLQSTWEAAFDDFRSQNNPPSDKADQVPTNDINESSGTTPETALPIDTAGGGVAPSISEQV